MMLPEKASFLFPGFYHLCQKRFRPKNQALMMQSLTPVVKSLLALNVGIFLLDWMTGGFLADLLMVQGLFSGKFIPTQLLTYMFAHGSFFHILSNMIFLIVFGPLVEYRFESRRFLIFYLLCGVGGAVVHLGINASQHYYVKSKAETYYTQPGPLAFEKFFDDFSRRRLTSQDVYSFLEKFQENPDNPQFLERSKQIVSQFVQQKSTRPMLGASGAVLGVAMAAALLFPQMQIFLLIPPIPVRLFYLVFFFVGLNLYWAVFGRDSNVAYLAHLGGAATGLIYVVLYKRNKT